MVFVQKEIISKPTFITATNFLIQSTPTEIEVDPKRQRKTGVFVGGGEGGLVEADGRTGEGQNARRRDGHVDRVEKRTDVVLEFVVVDGKVELEERKTGKVRIRCPEMLIRHLKLCIDGCA